MVQKLEAIRGGGGSIKVGTTGTISALMTMELESIKSAPQAAASCHDKTKTIPVSIPCSAGTPRRLQARKSLDEASSSGSSSSINRRSPETPKKMKNHRKSIHRMPMLSSDNATLDTTPSRDKIEKRGSNIVEIVDIGCGNTDRAWGSPITTKLKKLGFSKLSENIV